MEKIHQRCPPAIGPRLIPALAALDEIALQLRDGDPVVFLDFDGTLTPIVDRPDDARLSPAVRETLDALGRCLPVVIVSGRALDDIRQRIGLEHLYYSGNHGLEFAGPGGLSLRAPYGPEHLADMRAIAAQLPQALRDIPGIVLEDKGATLSVHFRRVPEAHVSRLEDEVNSTIAPFHNLSGRRGKKVIEVRPRIDWHKGSVVQWLLPRLGLPRPLPLYIGDDSTDEDALRIIAGHGIGIRVGDADSDSAARYFVPDVDDVHRFIRELLSRWRT